MYIYWAQRMAKSQEEKTLKNIKEVNEELKKYFSIIKKDMVIEE